MNTSQSSPVRDFNPPESSAKCRMPGEHNPRICTGAHHAAFTILELLVLIGLILFLASVAGAGLGRTRPNGQAVQCLSNLRRLAGAWQMYAHDNNDRIVPILQGGFAMGGLGAPEFDSWVNGWLDWTLSLDNTNVAL